MDTACTLADYLYVNVQLNHDREMGVGIRPHVHFWQAEDNVPNFLIRYRWQSNGVAKTTAWTNLPWATLAFDYTGGTLNNIANFGSILPPGGDGISSIVQIRLIRDTANASGEFAADPYTASVHLTSFDIHIKVDTLGSFDEYVKYGADNPTTTTTTVAATTTTTVAPTTTTTTGA
jgi:hypothetical protein